MASDINVVVLLGRIVRDVETKYSTSGTAIVKGSLATTKSVKRNGNWAEEAHFFDFTLIGTRGAAIAQYLTRGKQVCIKGSLEHERWQDRNTGENRSKVSILVNDIEMLGGNGGTSRGEQKQEPNDSGRYADDGFDDDIPF